VDGDAVGCGEHPLLDPPQPAGRPGGEPGEPPGSGAGPAHVQYGDLARGGGVGLDERHRPAGAVEAESRQGGVGPPDQLLRLASLQGDCVGMGDPTVAGAEQHPRAFGAEDGSGPRISRCAHHHVAVEGRGYGSRHPARGGHCEQPGMAHFQVGGACEDDGLPVGGERGGGRLPPVIGHSGRRRRARARRGVHEVDVAAGDQVAIGFERAGERKAAAVRRPRDGGDHGVPAGQLSGFPAVGVDDEKVRETAQPAHPVRLPPLAAYDVGLVRRGPTPLLSLDSLAVGG